MIRAIAGGLVGGFVGAVLGYMLGIFGGSILGAVALVIFGQALLAIGVPSIGVAVGTVVGTTIGICSLALSRKIVGLVPNGEIYIAIGAIIGILGGFVLVQGAANQKILVDLGLERGSYLLTLAVGIYVGILAGAINGIILGVRFVRMPNVARDVVKTRAWDSFLKKKIETQEQVDKN